ncbi:glycosyltransferase family 2 protein [Ilyomonas limi]|uniref:Glycosyltransferase family 2 protein n=1 Tax=Ilyomonas limi TaxID=2575867 RepID=A0A4U3L7G7_9BACT|nr:glycosyltransferase family 2 protein [Ilyomonas limi]TKK70334.1 glycosyltransferase family 2 protein [Ilyomonas limi]
MHYISICIPTYKRPIILTKLLLSIAKCNIDKGLINKVDIIVIDNDFEKTANEVVCTLRDKFCNLYTLNYHNYPVKGLANVRNKLIEESLKLDPDFLVFIDDDEYVTTNWLNELVITIVSNKADAARGPVIADITQPVSKNMSWLFKREQYANNTQLTMWTTGNLIIRCASLRKFNVWFDKRFNNTGSEDSYFGMQMTKKGATLFWAAQAITYEVIPEKRTKVEWFIRRTYRGGNMFMYMLKLEKKYLQVLKKTLTSFFYIILGLTAAPLMIMPVKIKYYGILKLSEGIGGLAGLFNLRYKEYK